MTNSAIAKNSKNIVFILLSTFFVLILLIYVSTSLKNYKPDTPNRPNIVVPKQEPAGVSVIGIVRSNGLSIVDKDELGLPTSDFQIIDSINNKSFFLVASEDLTLEKAIGKCVMVSGSYMPGWGQGTLQNSYARSALVADTFTITDLRSCEDPSYQPMPVPEEAAIIELTGIVQRIARPSPEVSYDYVLDLTFEYIDEFSASGIPTKLDSIAIVPVDFNSYIGIESAVDTETTMTGYMEYGLAESKHFKVISVN